MSEIKVNKISPRSGTDVTLGDSGDTFTVPSGATIVNNGTQTGFGRTGAVDWNTTKKTANFTATNGAGFFVDTNGGAITATLPASPSAGNIVYIKDYQGTFGTNACTVARNGSNIRGEASDFSLEKDNAGAVFIYVDATEGWQVFVDGSDSDAAATFIEATGGTVTTSGNFKIHTFTSPGTFAVSQIASTPACNAVDYLVVAGGGGGGKSHTSPNGASGGGGGGFRVSNDTCMPSPLTSPLANPSGITITAESFPITVGAGGAGATGPSCSPPGAKGSDSVFSSITSTGGGFGSGNQDHSEAPGDGGPGGSGGGAHQHSPSKSIGAGNTPPVSPPQGNNGGSGSSPSGEGGGGAGAAATNSTPGNNAGSGGIGSFVISAGFAGCHGTTGPVSSTRYFAGGAGGSNSPGRSPAGASGSGGAGGGGAGSGGDSGGTNTGGGGGATTGSPGGSGGSGIVILRYKFQ